jgi:hypothetical protein
MAKSTVPKADVAAGTTLLYPVSLVGAFGYVGTFKASSAASSELAAAAETASADGVKMMSVKIMSKQRTGHSKSVAAAHTLERDFLASISASTDNSVACLPKLVRSVSLLLRSIEPQSRFITS